MFQFFESRLANGPSLRRSLPTNGDSPKLVSKHELSPQENPSGARHFSGNFAKFLFIIFEDCTHCISFACHVAPSGRFCN